MRLLVTGSSGFIGSYFVYQTLQNTDHSVVAFARNSDMRNLSRLFGGARAAGIRQWAEEGRLRVVYGDLYGDVSGMCEEVDAVVHFAARTFVDHSIKDAAPFFQVNALGTYKLLEDARKFGVKRWVQISTDEVYGSILSGAYKEDSRLNPTNPYAASKASADLMVQSYANTYGMHTVITRTENNYGPYQHPQKVFPVFVRYALQGKPLPVYGDGQHVRQWLYVSDHCDAILFLLKLDTPPGEIYHVAGNQELKNIDLARMVLRHLGKSEDMIEFIDDKGIRPGHDRRYALNCDKLQALGWTPKVPVSEGIPRVVSWYAHEDNKIWRGA